MALKFPTLYQLKKAALYPRKIYMRHRENFEPGFIRSAMELHYYRPAFYSWVGAVSANSLLLLEVDIDSESIVVDAGAHTGEWAQNILDRYNPTVHAFEPDPRNYRQLEKKAHANSRLIPHDFGLGDKDESVRMTLEDMGSTIYTDGSDKTGVPSAEVQIRDITNAWESLGFHHVDLMKINIEGAEFPLLERMIEVDLLQSVGCFLIQFHEWHPGAYRRRRNIRKALGKTHQLVWDYHFVWEKWILK
jgi:FkbM family methyltransferase